MEDEATAGRSPATRESTTDRRTLLRTAGTTIVGAAGLVASSGSASALGYIPDVIEVEKGWFGWDADGSLPVTDELLVFIHGWLANIAVSSQAAVVRHSLESGGYSPDETVAIEWPATNFDYSDAEADTEAVGAVTADLVEDFRDAGGGAVRLVGHSLGGRCVYWTATKSDSGAAIATVAGLGTAAHGSEICGDPWNPGLDNACDVRNYHSENDSIVRAAYGGRKQRADRLDRQPLFSPNSSRACVGAVPIVSAHSRTASLPFTDGRAELSLRYGKSAPARRPRSTGRGEPYGLSRCRSGETSLRSRVVSPRSLLEASRSVGLAPLVSLDPRSVA